MFLKVLEMVNAFKAGDIKKGIALLLEILLEGVKSLGQGQKVFAAGPCPDCSGKTDNELFTELEGHCTAEKTAASSGKVMAGGAFFALILPYLLELFKRFFPKA